VLFSLHVKDRVQHVAGMLYAGSAVGAAFAGDLLTLFLFWELLGLSSTFLVWASRDDKSISAGMRYLLFQVLSGVLLMAGALWHWSSTGSLAFEEIGLASGASCSSSWPSASSAASPCCTTGSRMPIPPRRPPAPCSSAPSQPR